MRREDRMDPLEERALEWLVRLHSGEETEDDWHAYHEWRTASVENTAAAQRAERLWQQVGPALKPRRAGRVASGALVVALALLGGGALLEPFGPIGGWFADEATARGEVRVAVLADGSTVTLDTATSFDLDFSDGERRLLLRAGQVYVEVSPDSTRPFVIAAGGGTITALGTAFNVRAEGDAVAVSVTEHAVRVAYGDAPPVDVPEGWATAYAPRAGIAPATAVDADSVAAWRYGEIVFENRPLGAVIEEIGRYRRGAVVFTDGSLKELSVTGVFNTAAGDAFFAALEATLPVQVTELPFVTVIGRR